jgi:glycosyltransferase involved in cell wall biosynthesis
MRIALISHTDAPWTPHYARQLTERGHDVHVISFHPRPLPGVQVHFVVEGSAEAGPSPKYAYLFKVPIVRRLLRRLRPDVTLATYFRSNGLVGALAKCGPLVLSTRGVDYNFPLPASLNGRLIRWVAAQADLLHASSPELVDGLARYGIPPERFTVIPVGTDPQRFRPREGVRPPGPARILCTRKHHPMYDNPTIVRALGRLRDEALEFEARFVGTGTAIRETRELVARLGLADRVTFFGDVDYERVTEHLSWMDLYVSAATSDGSPSSLFEAMSVASFPVVTDVVANRAWIRHRENGWLFPVGDFRACAEGLRFAWDQREGQARIGGLLNRQTVIEKLDRSSGIVRLEKLLERAIEVHDRRAQER